MGLVGVTKTIPEMQRIYRGRDGYYSAQWFTMLEDVEWENNGSYDGLCLISTPIKVGG
jgi:hypothetical protein